MKRETSLAPGPPVAPPYVYACDDRSRLVQPFCRHVVRPFADRVPAVVPANLLTLGSSACMGLMLLLALVAPGPGWAPLFLLLMAAYVVYDHADGMHARRTGTSGPLGEFLDHFLDVFHAGIAVIALAAVAGAEDSPWLVPATAAVLTGSAATMVEQRERGVMHLGILGPLEGMLLMLAFLASCSFAAGVGWWRETTGGFTRIELTLIAGGLGGLGTAVACLSRMQRLPRELAAYLLATGILAWALERAGADRSLAAVVVMCHAADYVGRVIVSHLAGRPRPWPDFLAPAFAAFTVAFTWPGSAGIAGAALVLFVRHALLARQAALAFGAAWRWRNRP